MSIYVVQRKLPGVTKDQLSGAGARAKSCADELCQEGQEVRWLRSFYLPETEETHCYFEGPDAATIEELNRRAQIPFVAIREVVEMTPDSV